MQQLAAWRAWQESQGLSERTITERAATMRHLAHHADKELFDVTADDIIAYCGRPHLSQSSRASYHATIRAFYDWAQRTRLTDTNPADATPRPKRPKSQPRPLLTAHVNALFQVANRRRTRMMLTLATYAGLRVHEIAKFSGEDLDHIGGLITVTGKGGKTAILPAHEMILEQSKDFPKRGHWFPAYNGAPHVTPHAVSEALRGLMRRAGFEGKPHQLRHYYASELLNQGVDVRVVKELMRHESLATTEIYTKVPLSRMVEGIATLPLAA